MKNKRLIAAVILIGILTSASLTACNSKNPETATPDSVTASSAYDNTANSQAEDNTVVVTDANGQAITNVQSSNPESTNAESDASKPQASATGAASNTIDNSNNENSSSNPVSNNNSTSNSGNSNNNNSSANKPSGGSSNNSGNSNQNSGSSNNSSGSSGSSAQNPNSNNQSSGSDNNSNAPAGNDAVTPTVDSSIEGKISTTALASVFSLRHLMDNTPEMFAAAYLGKAPDNTASAVSIWCKSKCPLLVELYPFMGEMPQEHIVGTTGELFCVTPKDINSSVTVNQVYIDSTGKLEVLNVLYHSNYGDPVMFFANTYGEKSDVQVVIKDTKGNTVKWMPYMTSEGFINLPQNANGEYIAFDITPYNEPAVEQ